MNARRTKIRRMPLPSLRKRHFIFTQLESVWERTWFSGWPLGCWRTHFELWSTGHFPGASELRQIVRGESVGVYIYVVCVLYVLYIHTQMHRSKSIYIAPEWIIFFPVVCMSLSLLPVAREVSTPEVRVSFLFSLPPLGGGACWHDFGIFSFLFFFNCQRGRRNCYRVMDGWAHYNERVFFSQVFSQ